MTTTTAGYALQREHVANRSHSEPMADFETIAFYTEMPDDMTPAVFDHLFGKFGEDWKKNIFRRIETYLDQSQCGGKLIEATFLDGDVLRFWLQAVVVPNAGSQCRN